MDSPTSPVVPPGSPPQERGVAFAAHFGSAPNSPDWSRDEEPRDEEAENEVWGFGANAYHQLGVEQPESTMPLLIDSFRPLGKIAQIACGAHFTMILTASGKLFGIGRNNYYQIGVNDTNNHKKPQLVEALKTVFISQVDCGHEHSIALSAEGKVYGFGRNTQFQLANLKNTSQQPHLIQALEPLKAKQIACGSGYTMVVDDGGKIWGFGQNNSGQIGHRELTPQHTPRMVTAFKDLHVTQVSCGSTHTMVIAGGSLYAFGSDNCGQLGIGSTLNANMPTLVPGLANLQVARVTCGAYFTVARTEDGQVYGFGSNNHGQLGVGNTNNQSSPQQIPFDSDIVDVACGYNHTLFLTDDAKVYATGQSSQSQNGFLTTLTVPEEIVKMRDCKPNKIASGSNHCFVFQSSRGAAIMPASSLLYDIEMSFNNPELADVTFKVEGKNIYANKFILALRCEKFRTQFKSGMADSTSLLIEVNDTKYEHYCALLRYIYTDKADFPLQDCIEILNLANQHYLNRLVRICEKRIRRGIDESNAAYLFQVASMYETPNLKKFCLNYMIQPEHFDQVIKSDTFAGLSKKLILEVLAAKPSYNT